MKATKRQCLPWKNIIADWRIPVDISMTFPNRLWNANLSYPERGYMFGWGLAWMQGDTTKADRIFKNNYAINGIGNIITSLAKTSTSYGLGGGYGSASSGMAPPKEDAMTITLHDGSTLTPGFTTSPWTSNYTDISTNLPTMTYMTVGGSWYSATKIHVNYTDTAGQNIQTFLTDLNQATSHVKAYMNVAAEADKTRYVLMEFISMDNHTTYATLNVNTISVSAGSYGNSGDIFNYGESCVIEFTRTGERGTQGYTGYTGFQGFQGFRGDDADFSGLNVKSGEAAEADLRTIGGQIIPSSGAIKIYTANGTIEGGQVVCIDISPSGPVTVKACTNNTAKEDIIGIAVQRTPSGGNCRVLTHGYVTARWHDVLGRLTSPQLTSVLMGVEGSYGSAYGWESGSGTDSNPKDKRLIPVTGYINFKDDGGDNNYGASRNYEITFDTGASNVTWIKINKLNFEYNSSSLYDRLSVEYSSDNTTFYTLRNNVAPTLSNWMYYTTQTGLDKFQDDMAWANATFGGPADPSGGFVFPGQKTGGGDVTNGQNDSEGNAIPSDAIGTWHKVSARYVKFHFYSDSSNHKPGFDIDIASDNGGSQVGSIGDKVYLYTGDYSKLTNVSGGPAIGFLASTRLDNSGAYIRTLDFSVTDAAADGARGFQGSVGGAGAQGFTGFQGRTLSWWNNYVYNYDTALSGTPSTGKAQAIITPDLGPYEISEANKTDFNLERLVNLGVIRKEINKPSVGYTTYTLLRDISMNCEINGWRNVGDVTTSNWDQAPSGTAWAPYDFTYHNYLQLEDGYIFDGNGYEIKMDHSILWNDASGGALDAHGYYGEHNG